MTMQLLAEMPPSLQLLVAPIADTADAAFVVSLDCQFLAWGSRAQQLFGFSALDVLGRYCYNVMPARDASGQCLCGVNCPMVTAARYGYSAPPSEACICTKQNCPIWVRVSSIVLRARRGAICAILVLASDVTGHKITEQLVRSMAGRLDGGCDSPTSAIECAAPMLRSCFPDLTPRESEVLWEAVAGEDYHEIAMALGIKPATARNYLQRILSKLGVHSQRQAVLKAALALVSPQTRFQAAFRS
jgi:DNA-binding CsgD family transcriptional regulator